MTREEAIDILDDNFTVIDTHGHYTDEEVEQARQMAIEALGQEPCEDAISRQNALDCLTATGLKKFDFILDARDKIKNLPSVTPQYTDAEIQKMQELEQAEIEKAYELGKASQQKTGHWELYHKDADTNEFKCSQCGAIYCTDYDCRGSEYCPSCGAKMLEIPADSESEENDDIEAMLEYLWNATVKAEKE